MTFTVAWARSSTFQASCGASHASCKRSRLWQKVWVTSNPNTECMIQTLHEKRVISFASPTYFWAKATTEFRRRCGICILLLIFFSCQSHREPNAEGLIILLFTWQADRLDLFHSFLAVWSSRTLLTSAFLSVKWAWGFLPCLSLGVVWIH